MPSSFKVINQNVFFLKSRNFSLIDSLVDVVRTTIFTVLTQKFRKFSEFIVFRFLKNRENSVFGSKIVPTTFELDLTGSIYYGSEVTMYYTNLALFSVSKKYPPQDPPMRCLALCFYSPQFAALILS